MRRLHIIGKQNHGKTTLMVELVRELERSGKRVGTIKHSRHSHELDTTGKDSHRHREAGANPAAVVSVEMMGVFIPRSTGDDPYAALEPLYAGCDVVLVEGDRGRSEGLKVDGRRAAVGTAPLCGDPGRTDIVAVVSDDPVDTTTPRWPRSDVAAIARRVMDLLVDATA